MLLRTTAAAVITAAGLLLTAPAGLAATPGSAQVTGNQLKSALLPASYFGSGSTVSGVFSSGRHLENLPASLKPAKLSCADFWALYDAPGYGETSLASDEVNPNVNVSQGQGDSYVQAVYQFANSHKAAAFYGAEEARFAACRSYKESGGGSTFDVTQSVSKTHLDGHQAFLVTQAETFPSSGGVVLRPQTLVTTDGADVFMVQTTVIVGNGPATPSDAAVTARLITRVAALR
jgi:hypothetical protein